MQKVIKAIKDCVTSKTCCEETGVDCNQGRACPVRDGTHKPAEAVHRIHEPTVNHQLTIEREAFEKWLGIKPCGAAHDFGWAAWQARAALAATPEQDVVLHEPVREALEEAESVLNSINKGRAHAVNVSDEVCYWQRQEWIDWAEKEVLPKVRTAQALLATGGQAQAEHIKALIEVSRMPNQEHVADAHNAAVRHLRAIAAAKGEE